MLEIIVVVIVGIILLSRIKGALEKTKDDLKRYIDYSLEKMQAKLDGTAKKISPEPEVVKPAKPEMPPVKPKPVEPPVFREAAAALKPDIGKTVKTERKKTKFEETTGVILKKIWNWILVGEEHRPKNISMEYAVASTWLMRVGITALVICIGYFLKWSIDQGLLGPAGRVALSITAGVGMLILGIKNFRKKYDVLAQGFLGGGLAALYFSIYAAGPLYRMIPYGGAFVLMGLITVTAGVMAYKFNSQLVAIFGIIGGFCTPIILRTPGASPVVLYAYILLLGIGILGIAHVRNWRLLNYLGFVFTWLLILMSLSGYQVERDFKGTITLITLLFILHATIVYYYNLIKRRHSSSLEIAHMLVNSVFYALTAHALILEACGRPWPAVMAIGVALFYITQIYVFLKNRVNDRNLLVCLIGMAGFFTAWAVPMIAEKETITICWALQAFFFLWIGLKLNSNLLINLSHILYLLVAGRVAAFDLQDNFYGRSFKGVLMREYWPVFFERIWNFGPVIASFFGAFALHKRKINQMPGLALEESNNTRLLINRPASREILFWSGVIFLFIIFYFELLQMFTYYLPLQMPVLTMLMCVLGAYFLYNYFSTGKKSFLPVAVCVMAAVLFKLFFFDYSCWESSLFYICEQGFIGMLARFIDFGVVFLYVFALMRLVSGKTDLNVYRRTFTVIATVLLFVYVSLETNTFFYWYVPDFQQGAISVAWALFAIAYLVIGLMKSSKAWRYSGLILFTIVAAKVFIIDLACLEIIHRVIAFMIVGMILIGGSFAYINAGKKFRIEEEK